jgi:hypothetical protein
VLWSCVTLGFSNSELFFECDSICIFFKAKCTIKKSCMYQETSLKGQCHEIEVEMRSWSRPIPKLSMVNTFSILKLAGSTVSYGPKSSASIDVNLGSQIRRILPKLRFQLRFSTWHISVWGLQTAHVCTDDQSLSCPCFAASFYRELLSYFSETTSMQNWQFASRLEVSFVSLQ